MGLNILRVLNLVIDTRKWYRVDKFNVLYYFSACRMTVGTKILCLGDNLQKISNLNPINKNSHLKVQILQLQGECIWGHIPMHAILLYVSTLSYHLYRLQERLVDRAAPLFPFHSVL